MFRWFPVRYFLSKIAKSQGFLDPILLTSKLQKLAEPSEISEPIELLRAGAIFHARGLVNAKVLQQNLDWIWPYWVQRQFNPYDKSFLPRAFSITHVNLTHRNWTAVGIPGIDHYPIVDPRGMITPHFDGCSIDFLVEDDKDSIIPAKEKKVSQTLDVEDNLHIQTEFEKQKLSFCSDTYVKVEDQTPFCIVKVKAKCKEKGKLSLLIRPVNPEGISFIHSLEINHKDVYVDNSDFLTLDKAPHSSVLLNYKEGDSALAQNTQEIRNKVKCDIGLANLSLRYNFNKEIELKLKIPLVKSENFFMEKAKEFLKLEQHNYKKWSEFTKEMTTLKTADKKINFLFKAAAKNTLLMSPKEVFPGPYTYKRFWFRDAVFILNAIISLNMLSKAREILDEFPKKQRGDGYFLSQEGEWDSNGQVLWIYFRYYQVSKEKLTKEDLEAIPKGARWIIQKRNKTDNSSTSGLMPAGFSAEHFGVNDNYYWDSMFSAYGLLCAGELLKEHSCNQDEAELFIKEGKSLKKAIEKSIDKRKKITKGAVATSAHRRMDSAAVGSLAGLYPLDLFENDDKRFVKTAKYLRDNCFFEGGFFQDMIHSGINAYLSLHVAQVFLKAGFRDEFIKILERVKELATSTGQWPEAIHPITKGGCMGDGEHIWATAEWIMAIKNAFIIEQDNKVILFRGVPKSWLIEDKQLCLNNIATSFGVINLKSTLKNGKLKVAIENLNKEVEVVFDMFNLNKKYKENSFKVNIDEYINDDKYL
jgi:GH15 family glucan-1,4-alpha-glucosidase